MVEATYSLSEAPERAKPMTHIMKGFGFNVGHDFVRADRDIPIEIDAERGSDVYGYIAGNPQSTLGFLRAARVRVRVDRRCIAHA